MLSVVISSFSLTGCSQAEEPDPTKDEDNMPGVPPFSGTIFIDPDIVIPADSTVFLELVDSGQGDRQVFDRREDAWITINAFLFRATFADGPEIEFRINPEYENVDNARNIAYFYAPLLGQLPTVLRTDVQSVTIHKGIKPFGGGNADLLIHAGQGEQYLADGIREETLFHEASHTSLDDVHAKAGDWIAAQKEDNNFISIYACDFPEREDIAETFLLYFALRYRQDRITSELAQTIERTIPNRINYLDAQKFDMSPID